MLLPLSSPFLDENLSKGDYIQEQVGGGFLDLPLTSTQLRTSIKATLRDSGVVQKSRSRQTKLVKKVPRNPITATSQNYTPKPFTVWLILPPTDSLPTNSAVPDKDSIRQGL
ncbi:hypothetical protein SERLADRAFT_432035 [Serpula lacrymans var. lacrymans S7.9]|uniref:Uncharacterized protein n=1 Tax=Serpula lacrymans var. lacrymans (strain S7.9) TaxID=578457 RepID=F8NE93_SERL9|nr:uncharacterized protein SERLADRAFT_432035 [Serpula lacrymans var. lacrymans S7.9]EGO30475.1 hypothetical protein SERLADRAFT_432035 [Serpula lacrymans var. lacrymans S7.9]